MPNWCSNTLKVYSENTEKLKEFAAATIVPPQKEDDYKSFTLDTLVPCPPELLDENAFGKSENTEQLIEKYGYSDWYSWRVANWGTKWNASEAWIEYEDGDTDMTVSFDTAWAPPVPWVITVGKMFPELKFSILYEEPGCDFCGYYIMENGEPVDYDESNYEYIDNETGRYVMFDGESRKWVFSDTNEVASDDEDYWPEGHNPFSEMV